MYSKTYNNISEDDLRSTSPDCFYRKKDGEENPQCSKLGKNWKN
eukprot:CAMPEP_0117081064 /NCGR_PEP_ID=MMETSP0472-20121206/57164_1 /TAXON_ID=693140 ORGANISM="Tiarina fusus, Strain LIS" /NCGR_SAMPLE_ID=MMETSP0472 /ASSEMBLY_ACC=CAM_ASM_000603 /LENGTH=43 /DNA_ID= /DNA_START= /DNA_END= /DNA_ORIENTATION=